MTRRNDEDAAVRGGASSGPPPGQPEPPPSQPEPPPSQPDPAVAAVPDLTGPRVPVPRAATSAPLATVEPPSPRTGGSWSPGATVAARRRIPGLDGRWIDAGTKGVVVAGDGSGHCTVRFQTAAILAGLDGDDIVVIPSAMRC